MAEQQDYLFFSSTELMEFFFNNIKEKDIKTQTKRIFEMAKIFLSKKEFQLEDVYSVLVMVRDIAYLPVIEEVFSFYFKKDRYPMGLIIETTDLEETADLEMEFSSYRGEKIYLPREEGINTAFFSAGATAEEYVHCSGVSAARDGAFPQQVRDCLEGLAQILKTGGSDLRRGYSFMIYVRDPECLPQVEEILAEYGLDGEESVKEAIVVQNLEKGRSLAISCSAYREGAVS